MADGSRNLTIDALPDPAWIVDRDGLGILETNSAALAWCGRSPEAGSNLRLPDLLTPGEAAGGTDALRASAAGEAMLTFRHRDGAPLRASVRWRALQADEDPADARRGELLLIARPATTTDEDRVRMRLAGELLQLGRWRLDPATRRIEWSSEAASIHGAPDQDPPGTVDDYLERVLEEDREALEKAFAPGDLRADSVVRFAHRIRRPDGSVRHLEGIGELATDEGRPQLIGVVRDVSERQGRLERLSETTRLARLAEEMAGVGGWRVDLADQSIRWTSNIARLHQPFDGEGSDVDQALERYAPEDRERIRARFEACALAGTSFDEIAGFDAPRRGRLWVRVIGEPVRADDGRIVAIEGAFQDLTELIEARTRYTETAERLEATLEHISDAFFTLDRQWRFRYLNSQAEQLLQRERGAVLGRVVWDLFPEAVGSTFEREYQRALAEQRSVHFTEYFEPLDRHFRVSAQPSPEGLAVYFTDVSDLRRREAQLQLLQTAVSRLNDIVIITEAEPISDPGPRIVYVNDAFEHLTGWSRDEAIGRAPRILQGPATDRDELDRIRDALERWEPVRTELINYRRDGTPLWLEIDIVPIADEHGWYTHWVAVERDVSERHRSEEALRIRDERFRLLSRATADVIRDWDLREDHVWWSEAMETRFEQDRAKLAPGIASWRDHVHPEDRSEVDEALRRFLAGTDEHWHGEYRFLRGDGSTAHVVDRGFAIRDADGRAVRMIGSMIDVTERRELEQRLRQAQKMEAVGQLTGGVAHDFNNLLTVILGNAELTIAEVSDAESVRMLAEMTVAAAERGAELTQRLLAFARRQALQPAIVDLNRLVGGMEALLRRTLKETIELEFVRAGGLWSTEVDPGQLEVALLNLAINARDAMPQGGRLTLETGNAYLDAAYARLHDEVQPGQYVMVSVTDTGTGMDAETVAQAFEPFFTTKEIGQGTGLGLSMVWGFTKQSSGHARIYSEPGEGTTVRLYFPRAGVPARDVDDERTDPVAGGREHILVVEDDPLVRRHLVAQLDQLGYRVTVAESGSVALTHLEGDARIDLLFTDVVMPGMNGRELADAARALRPDLKVLFTSGYTENAIVHQGRLDPGVELLSKPYRRQDLADRLRRILGDPC